MQISPEAAKARTNPVNVGRLSAYVYDARLQGGRYVNARTGRIVKNSEVHGALAQAVDDLEETMVRLAQLVARGDISERAFYEAMTRTVRHSYNVSTALACGGWASVSQAQWGTNGGLLRQEYGRLVSFANDIANGRYTDKDGVRSEKAIVARARLYANTAYGRYWAIEDGRQLAGSNRYERLITVGDDRTCDECHHLETYGWVPVGTHVLPIHPACRCRKEYSPVFEPVVAKHHGPGPHESGSSQDVHGGDACFESRVWSGPDTLAQKWIDEAKKSFGTTEEFFQAGYVLPDGTMLDFHKEGRGWSARRSFEHDEIKWADPDPKNSRGDTTGYPPFRFMRSTGAVRIAVSQGGAIASLTSTTREDREVSGAIFSLEAMRPLTDSQMQRLYTLGAVRLNWQVTNLFGNEEDHDSILRSSPADIALFDAALRKTRWSSVKHAGPGAHPSGSSQEVHGGNWSGPDDAGRRWIARAADWFGAEPIEDVATFALAYILPNGHGIASDGAHDSWLGRHNRVVAVEGDNDPKEWSPRSLPTEDKRKAARGASRRFMLATGSVRFRQRSGYGNGDEYFVEAMRGRPLTESQRMALREFKGEPVTWSVTNDDSTEHSGRSVLSWSDADIARFAAAVNGEASFAKHAGPGPHPGTGTLQEAHAGHQTAMSPEDTLLARKRLAAFTQSGSPSKVFISPGCNPGHVRRLQVAIERAARRFPDYKPVAISISGRLAPNPTTCGRYDEQRQVLEFYGAADAGGFDAANRWQRILQHGGTVRATSGGTVDYVATREWARMATGPNGVMWAEQVQGELQSLGYNDWLKRKLGRFSVGDPVDFLVELDAYEGSDPQVLALQEIAIRATSSRPTRRQFLVEEARRYARGMRQSGVKHAGPGAHPSGSSQSVHAGGGGEPDRSERTKNWVANVVRGFGLTDNIEEMGFILPDGRMLDMSSKERYWTRGYRYELEHNDVSRWEPVDKISSQRQRFSSPLSRFLSDTGAVRVRRWSSNDEEFVYAIEASRPLTQNQERLLSELEELEYVWDVTGLDGLPLSTGRGARWNARSLREFASALRSHSPVKHAGPGLHPSGSQQSVHGGSRKLQGFDDVDVPTPLGERLPFQITQEQADEWKQRIAAATGGSLAVIPLGCDRRYVDAFGAAILEAAQDMPWHQPDEIRFVPRKHSDGETNAEYSDYGTKDWIAFYDANDFPRFERVAERCVTEGLWANATVKGVVQHEWFHAQETNLTDNIAYHASIMVDDLGLRRWFNDKLGKYSSNNSYELMAEIAAYNGDVPQLQAGRALALKWAAVRGLWDSDTSDRAADEVDSWLRTINRKGVAVKHHGPGPHESGSSQTVHGKLRSVDIGGVAGLSVANPPLRPGAPPRGVYDEWVDSVRQRLASCTESGSPDAVFVESFCNREYVEELVAGVERAAAEMPWKKPTAIYFRNSFAGYGQPLGRYYPDWANQLIREDDRAVPNSIAFWRCGHATEVKKVLKSSYASHWLAHDSVRALAVHEWTHVAADEPELREKLRMYAQDVSFGEGSFNGDELKENIGEYASQNETEFLAELVSCTRKRTPLRSRVLAMREEVLGIMRAHYGGKGDVFVKHLGPGNHPSGSPQSVHGKPGGEAAWQAQHGPAPDRRQEIVDHMNATLAQVAADYEKKPKPANPEGIYDGKGVINDERPWESYDKYANLGGGIYAGFSTDGRRMLVSVFNGNGQNSRRETSEWTDEFSSPAEFLAFAKGTGPQHGRYKDLWNYVHSDRRTQNPWEKGAAWDDAYYSSHYGLPVELTGREGVVAAVRPRPGWSSRCEVDLFDSQTGALLATQTSTGDVVLNNSHPGPRLYGVAAARAWKALPSGDVNGVLALRQKTLGLGTFELKYEEANWRKDNPETAAFDHGAGTGPWNEMRAFTVLDDSRVLGIEPSGDGNGYGLLSVSVFENGKLSETTLAKPNFIGSGDSGSYQSEVDWTAVNRGVDKWTEPAWLDKSFKDDGAVYNVGNGRLASALRVTTSDGRKRTAIVVFDPIKTEFGTGELLKKASYYDMETGVFLAKENVGILKEAYNAPRDWGGVPYTLHANDMSFMYDTRGSRIRRQVQLEIDPDFGWPFSARPTIAAAYGGMLEESVFVFAENVAYRPMLFENIKDFERKLVRREGARIDDPGERVDLGLSKPYIDESDSRLWLQYAGDHDEFLNRSSDYLDTLPETPAGSYLIGKQNVSKWNKGMFDLESDAERTRLKESVSRSVAKSAGVSEELASDFVALWAATSNEGLPSGVIQQEASKLFGVPLSEYQKDAAAIWWARRDRALEGSLGSAGLEAATSLPFERNGPMTSESDARNRTRKVLEQMYAKTQKDLSDAGVDEVVLFRGVKTRGIDANPQAVRSARLQSSVLESWTLSPLTAAKFGDTVLAARFPRKRIFSTPRTGFGCWPEYEFVVIGDNEQDEVAVYSFGLSKGVEGAID